MSRTPRSDFGVRQLLPVKVGVAFGGLTALPKGPLAGQTGEDAPAEERNGRAHLAVAESVPCPGVWPWPCFGERARGRFTGSDLGEVNGGRRASGRAGERASGQAGRRANQKIQNAGMERKGTGCGKRKINVATTETYLLFLNCLALTPSPERKQTNSGARSREIPQI
jgi:hypothetical protein